MVGSKLCLVTLGLLCMVGSKLCLVNFTLSFFRNMVLETEQSCNISPEPQDFSGKLHDSAVNLR
jgi:hypothetical protein